MTHTRMFGVHVPVTDGDPTDELTTFGAIAGQRPHLLNLFARFGPGHPVLTRTAKAAAAIGVHPIITLEPSVPLEEIAAGRHDELLGHWMVGMAGLRCTVRWAHEMNGDWYPWAGRPAAYVAAWRHVREVFAEVLPDVDFLWCPNRAYNTASQFGVYWPGSEYVDRVGIDAYNLGAPWTTPADLMAADFRRLRAIAPDKPLALVETGCMPGPERAAWMNQLGYFLDWTPVSWWLMFYADKPGRPWVFGQDAGAVREYRAMIHRWING